MRITSNYYYVLEAKSLWNRSEAKKETLQKI